MASDDQESRTEEPTERKLSDAIEKGNVPFAREAVTLGTMLAILLACQIMMPWATLNIMSSLTVLLENSGLIRLESHEGAALLFHGAVLKLGTVVLAVAAVIAGGGIAASLLQNVPQAATDRITPKWSRISPAAGWNRLFSMAGAVEFLKTVGKSAAVLATTWLVMRSEADAMLGALKSEPSALPATLLAMVVKIIAVLCVISLLLALFDITWSRLKWRRSLRMTRQEIKEEFRQSEGDPHIKARIRSIARQRSSKKMFAKLPTATMIITNPTHFAVALRYRREEGGAPIVVAKGVDFLAQRIRETAAEHEIPLVENRPLARALYEKVEIDETIPAEFYKAVAEIIHFLELRRLYPPGSPLVR